mmetsp:Transcript_19221/g.47506  ORF Transcript_19221/g.47506 Transcript_19221/m.47506 type:complete len:393 (+) Transcript_19221:113-1291(+)|eukprot:CAMPEP_0113620080 /NCGR_PEP_ID=MMETSP0017_2-20120614/10217_1 /TAXON_ID=2856 /ORGANISM="Cylindrotheca closterium" /LENGTH=392 /DNA_ID=CAMNT_0000529707 /DNA_START=113 /DNA_END=1291 /DNA_ORIENTATION=- /assembly_acc=CAM_ASM_000147
MLHRTVLRLALCLLVFVSVGAESSPEEQETPPEPILKKPEVEDKFDAEGHTDWGSYYDPQNIFCGKFDCYKILGFDYGEWATDRPSTKQITKRYRALSRAWHPDKSKHKDAKDRFVKIARAYEVLTDFEQRKEYDLMRFNQDAYYNKYGSGVIFTYAPKSDVTIIVIFVLALLNLYTWFAQKNRWQNVANRLIKASVEDWSPSMGGTAESKRLRVDALDVLKEKEAANATTETAPAAEKKGKAKKVKISAKEKKLIEQEALRPIITEMVEKIDDFGAGFHKPTWEDLFIVNLVKFPVKFASGLAWQTKYWIRRLQKKELNDEERAVLTERAVGHVNWELASDEDRQGMIKLELWVKENFLEWTEEQEFKKLSKSEQKAYKRMKRGGSKDHLE